MSGVSRRAYSGDPLDHSWQYFHERPTADDDDTGETVYATDPEPAGEENAENVPVPDDGQRPINVDGQTTFKDWGWST